MDKLKVLLARCKAGVYLEVNAHRDVYMPVATYLSEESYRLDDLCGAMRQMMIELDTVIHLQFYPDTPISSYSIWHYDLDKALDEALDCLGISIPQK